GALGLSGVREALGVVGGKVQGLGPRGWNRVDGADEPMVALGPRLALGLDGGVYAVEARLRRLPGIDGFKPRRVAAGQRVLVVGEMGEGWAAAVLANGKPSPLRPLPRA